jgi:hypothetical protein
LILTVFTRRRTIPADGGVARLRVLHAVSIRSADCSRLLAKSHVKQHGIIGRQTEIKQGHRFPRLAQQHSVRGFLAGMVRTRLKLRLGSKKVDSVRVYQIAGVASGKHEPRKSKRQAS